MKSYIYLTSFEYSGSTLLSFLIDSHPKVASVGELNGPNPGNDLYTYNCSCKNRLIDCKFWINIQQQMSERNLPLKFHNFKTTYFSDKPIPFLYKLMLYTLKSRVLNILKDVIFQLDRSHIKHINEINRRCVAMAEIITKAKNADHFFDTTKDYDKLKYLSNVKNLNFKVVLVIRDARSLVYSFLKRHTNVTTDEAARTWLQAMQIREEIIKNYIPSNRLIRIKYEDLCRKPEETLAKVYSFIGVENHPLMLPLKTENHHIIGNKMRLADIKDIRLDEKWKTELNAEQKAIIETIAGTQNRLYGYI